MAPSVVLPSCPTVRIVEWRASRGRREVTWRTRRSSAAIAALDATCKRVFARFSAFVEEQKLGKVAPAAFDETIAVSVVPAGWDARLRSRTHRRPRSLEAAAAQGDEQRAHSRRAFLGFFVVYERALATGEKRREQLRSENGRFAFPRAKVKLGRPASPA